MPPDITTLEREARDLRVRISALNDELEVTNGLINAHYAKESGLLGRIARSDRAQGGLKIEHITFKTWAPSEPQAVSGYRLTGSGAYTTIHLNSPGFIIE
ncbi:hypothetical protein IB276_33275 [Ensifer sp. ENS04]|uniref:hypothetical protein n=1 Tax=Ensifer sp. ENS04 TaxID=2769281 RepID=UPI001781A27E|nr:hypothetical protein [Ensifer sp. ENS04]MBD9544320.1 hypothetical protein [Ensifer sp. ENS04]